MYGNIVLNGETRFPNFQNVTKDSMPHISTQNVTKYDNRYPTTYQHMYSVTVTRYDNVVVH